MPISNSGGVVKSATILASGTFSSSANLDVSSISANYAEITLEVDLTLSADADVNLKINNNSPANKHGMRQFQVTGATGIVNANGAAQLNISPSLASYHAQYIRIDIPYYAAARQKIFEVLAHQLTNTTNADVFYESKATFDSTNAITELTLTPSAGNFASGAWRLLGWTYS